MSHTFRFHSLITVLLCLAALTQAQRKNDDTHFAGDFKNATVLGATNTNQAILFISNRNGVAEVFSMNPDGTAQRQLSFGVATQFETPRDVLSAKWSRDGRKIVFHRKIQQSIPVDPYDQITVMNADGSFPAVIPSQGNQPSFSPDGRKIIFTRCNPFAGCDIYTMNSDGSAIAELSLANTTLHQREPSYSPDGTKIVFTCSDNSTGRTGICTVNADGSGRQILTSYLSVDYAPVFSPDGTKIAFTRKESNDSTNVHNIFILNADGSGLLRVTTASTVCQYPAWSPDGDTLAYSRQTGSGNTTYEVFSIGIHGQNNTRLMENSFYDFAADWRWAANAPARTPFDFDGDSKADISVFRPSNNNWYIRDETAGYSIMTWGVTGDVLAPADYDGDWKTDIAVWRPSNGTWFVFNSESQTFQFTVWGMSGDLPVSADHDGDGKADLMIYRPSTGQWHLRKSSTDGTYSGTFRVFNYGIAGDEPLVGDFDGDSRADVAVFRPSNTTWYFQHSYLNRFDTVPFGQSGDIAVPADYDGDGTTDTAVWRAATGAWVIRFSSDGSVGGDTWGIAGDKPVPADYDGDGKAELAIFRSSNSTWYIFSLDRRITITTFGETGDLPIPNTFVP